MAQILDSPVTVDAVPPARRPGRRGLSRRYQQILDELRAEPGVWKLIATSEKPTTVGQNLRRYGVQVSRRTIDGVIHIYARFVEPF